MLDECAVIIDQLTKRRHSLGMTQQELASASGLTQSVIARLESKRAMPQLNTLMRVVAALNCSLVIVTSPEDRVE